MDIIKRTKFIYRYLGTADRFMYTFYFITIFGSIIALYFVVFLKILNVFNVLNQGFFKSIATINFSYFGESYFGGIAQASIILFYLSIGIAGNKLSYKALSMVPEEQLSPVDKRNLYLEKNAIKVFKEGIEVLKKDGFIVFLKKDPLEIKRAVFYLTLLLVPLYLLYVL